MTTFLLRRRAFALLAAFVVFAGACSGKHVTAPGFSGGTRVLFIGNSLTYTNNLPSMYLAVARQAGDDSVKAAEIAFPDYALEDHWQEGTARRSLAESKWEFVIMQQGSSALPESQIHLRTWAERFAPVVREAGATPVMFMVWPFYSREFDFPNVQHSYSAAAAAINGIFAPAGDAWVAHGSLTSLYSDGLHPSIKGTYMAALVLLERTLGIAPEQLPLSVPGVPSISETEVRAMQQAVRVALDRNPKFPTNGTNPQ